MTPSKCVSRQSSVKDLMSVNSSKDQDHDSYSDHSTTLFGDLFDIPGGEYRRRLSAVVLAALVAAILPCLLLTAIYLPKPNRNPVL